VVHENRFMATPSKMKHVAKKKRAYKRKPRPKKKKILFTPMRKLKAARRRAALSRARKLGLAPPAEPKIKVEQENRPPSKAELKRRAKALKNSYPPLKAVERVNYMANSRMGTYNPYVGKKGMSVPYFELSNWGKRVLLQNGGRSPSPPRYSPKPMWSKERNPPAPYGDPRYPPKSRAVVPLRRAMPLTALTGGIPTRNTGLPVKRSGFSFFSERLSQTGGVPQPMNVSLPTLESPMKTEVKLENEMTQYSFSEQRYSAGAEVGASVMTLPPAEAEIPLLEKTSEVKLEPIRSSLATVTSEINFEPISMRDMS